MDLDIQLDQLLIFSAGALIGAVLWGLWLWPRRR